MSAKAKRDWLHEIRPNLKKTPRTSKCRTLIFWLKHGLRNQTGFKLSIETTKFDMFSKFARVLLSRNTPACCEAQHSEHVIGLAILAHDDSFLRRVFFTDAMLALVFLVAAAGCIEMIQMRKQQASRSPCPAARCLANNS